MHCCRAFPLRWLGFLVRDILSICQMHILLSRTAQISLELHFCVELHTKKALMWSLRLVTVISRAAAFCSMR